MTMISSSLVEALEDWPAQRAESRREVLLADFVKPSQRGAAGDLGHLRERGVHSKKLMHTLLW